MYEAVPVTVVPLHDNDSLHLYNKSIAERLLYTPTSMVRTQLRETLCTGRMAVMAVSDWEMGWGVDVLTVTNK